MSIRDPITSSRITPPSLHPTLAPRSSLLREINANAERLIYVVSPPGFGKTILASQWLSEYEEHGIWIRADQFDSEERFLSVAVAAFQRKFPEFAGWFAESLLE